MLVVWISMWKTYFRKFFYVGNLLVWNKIYQHCPHTFFTKWVIHTLITCFPHSGVDNLLSHSVSKDNSFVTKKYIMLKLRISNTFTNNHLFNVIHNCFSIWINIHLVFHFFYCINNSWMIFSSKFFSNFF